MIPAVPASPPSELSPFYVTGGTLPADASSYVVRRADADLLSGLLSGEFCYVLNTRQMGKSSLMIRTAGRLREEGVAVAVLDLTAVGQNLTPEQWYDGLLVSLGEQLHLEDDLDDFWSEHGNLGPLQRFFAAVGQVVLPALGEKRLVVFVDEIDAVRSLPFSADEFFAGVRECYNRRTQNSVWNRLVFCLLGVATPADLITDTRMSPFNVGRRIIITDFTPQEAAPLAKGLGENGTALLARALFWTSGHPYMTQRLCRAIAEEPNITAPRQVDALCERLFLTKQARDTDDNLAFVRNRLLRSEADLASLLDLYTQVRNGRRVKDDETNPLVPVLRLSGVATVANDFLRVRNRVYDRVFDKEWVLAHMPDAELRRQKAAYRLGQMRSTAVAAVVVALVGTLAWTSVQSARTEARAHETVSKALARARKDQERAGDMIYASQMNLAHLAYKDRKFSRAHLLVEQHRPQPDAPDRRDPDPPDRRDFVWRYLWRLCRSWDRFTFPSRVGEVNSSAFSPDGKVLAVGGADGAIQLWTMPGHTLLDTVKVHPGGCVIAFSPDGKQLASLGREDGTIQLWDSTARPVKPIRRLKGFVREWTRIVFTPDGKTLIAGSDDNTIHLWALENGTGAHQADRSIPMKASGPLALSPDGSTLAICGAGADASRVRLWDIRSPRPKPLQVSLPPVGGLAQCVAFSPNGRMLVTGTAALILWDASAGRKLNRKLKTLTEHEGVVFCAGFSPNGKVLASGGVDGVIRLWDPVSGDLLATLPGHSGRILSLAFSPKGDVLASTGSDGTTRLWDTDSKKIALAAAERSEAQILPGDHTSVRSVTFSRDGKLLAEVRTNAVTLWNVRTGERVWRSQLDKPGSRAGFLLLPRGLAFAPDGKLLAIGSPDGRVQLWDVSVGHPIRTFLANPSGVTHLGIADGNVLVTSNGGAVTGVKAMVRLWNVGSGDLLAEIAGNSRMPLGSMALSADGRTLAAVSPDRRVTLWDIGSRRKVMAFESEGRVSSLAFSRNGNLVAAGVPDGGIFIWNRTTGQRRRLLGHVGPVLALAFSPDGKTLATGGMDATVRLWNPEVDQEEVTLTGHTDWVWSLAFSADGNTLASGSPDGTVRLWRAAPLSESDALHGPTLIPRP